MDKEPALYVGAITAFLTTAIGLGAAFGLDISEEQRNAVISCVAPTVGLIILMAAIIRQLVWSPSSVQKLKDAAYERGQSGEQPPVQPL